MMLRIIFPAIGRENESTRQFRHLRCNQGTIGDLRQKRTWRRERKLTAGAGAQDRAAVFLRPAIPGNRNFGNEIIALANGPRLEFIEEELLRNLDQIPGDSVRAA